MVVLNGDSNVCFGSPGRFRAEAYNGVGEGDLVRWQVRKVGDRDGREDEEEEEEVILLQGEEVIGAEEEEEEEADRIAEGEDDEGKKGRKGKAGKGRGSGKRRSRRRRSRGGRRTLIAFDTLEVITRTEVLKDLRLG